MLKCVFVVLALTSAAFTHAASSKIQIPVGYLTGWNKGENNVYMTSLSKKDGEEQLVFLNADVSDGIKPKNEDIWEVVCKNEIKENSPKLNCEIYNKHLTVKLLSDNIEYTSFRVSMDPNTMIHFKVDDIYADSINMYMVDLYKSSVYVYFFLKGQKLDYSWGNSKETINLKGFNEAYDFAKKAMKLNNRIR